MSTQGIKFTKQTMKLDIAWKAAKDFDLHYVYKNQQKRILNSENGCNHPNGSSSEIAVLDKYQHFSGYYKDSLYNYAAQCGGTPRPAFTVAKGTPISVKFVSKWAMEYEILDGFRKGTKFTADLVCFRTCLIGESKEDLTVSKYRILFNGEVLKSKYYTNMKRVKLALLNAFGYSNPEMPYFIVDSNSTPLSYSDCKNVQIMEYVNDSKIGTLVSFNVAAFYKQKMNN